jgi:hypothetical protein
MSDKKAVDGCGREDEKARCRWHTPRGGSREETRARLPLANNRMLTRANPKTSKDRHRKGALRAVVALLLPGTLPARLAALGFILAYTSGLPFPQPFISPVRYVAAVAFIAAGLLAAGEYIHYDDEGPEDWASQTIRSILWLAALAIPIAVVGGAVFLAYLVSAGQKLAGSVIISQINNHAHWDWPELGIVLAILWLLVGVPNQAFMASVDNEGTGDAQRALVKLLTAAACALSALLLIVMHLNGGPLSKLHVRPLVIGIVFTVVLVAPFYRSVARAFWRRGLSGLLGLQGFKQFWGNTSAEVRIAFSGAGDGEVKLTTWQRVLLKVVVYKGFLQYWELDSSRGGPPAWVMDYIGWRISRSSLHLS